MIRIEECTDRCDSDNLTECEGLIHKAVRCNHTCPFYKPVGCGDWIRSDEWLIPPEEYERMYKHDYKSKEVHWHIKRVPTGKK